jgi:hypothetical protein
MIERSGVRFSSPQPDLHLLHDPRLTLSGQIAFRTEVLRRSLGVYLGFRPFVLWGLGSGFLEAFCLLLVLLFFPVCLPGGLDCYFHRSWLFFLAAEPSPRPRRPLTFSPRKQPHSRFGKHIENESKTTCRFTGPKSTEKQGVQRFPYVALAIMTLRFAVCSRSLST